MKQATGWEQFKKMMIADMVKSARQGQEALKAHTEKKESEASK
jgi:hypothetical protein